jgi:hypothetical protein
MSRKFDFLKASRPAKSPRTQKSEDPEIRQPAARSGRPAGKRTDPDYTQITAYIRKVTHHAVKLRLLQEGQGREFSELVEELLRAWLAAI